MAATSMKASMGCRVSARMCSYHEFPEARNDVAFSKTSCRFMHRVIGHKGDRWYRPAVVVCYWEAEAKLKARSEEAEKAMAAASEKRIAAAIAAGHEAFSERSIALWYMFVKVLEPLSRAQAATQAQDCGHQGG